MREPTDPKLPKWPFYLGNALLLAAAWVIWNRGGHPFSLWELTGFVACAAGGAVVSVWPFILEYRTASKVAEVGAFASVMSEVKKLEDFAAQVGTATGRWQYVQEQAEKTAAAAGAITDRMTAELKAFSEFMARANDSEKSTLRLENEKLRRVEGEWVSVLVRVLDHIFALHQAALKSEQQNLIQQVGSFQHACREAARRVGLTPFVAQSPEPFDAQRHKSVDGDGNIAPDAVVSETLATGFTFQGQVIRPALVRLAEKPV